MLADIFETIKRLYQLPNIVLLTISCLLCAIYWRRLSFEFKLLAMFLWFSYFIEMGAGVFATVWHNNRPLLHLLALGEFIFWSCLYRSMLGQDSMLYRYFSWILGLGILAIGANSVFLQSIWESNNTYSKTGVQMIVIWYAIAFAFHFAVQSPQKAKENKLLRLVNAAILIYYCGSLFIFMSGFAVGSSVFVYLRSMNIGLNCVFQILVLYALWKVIFNHPNSYSSSVSRS